MPPVPWIVSAEDARRLIASGALLLDAREPPLKRATPVAGAVDVRWEEFSEPSLPDVGNLLRNPARLARRLQAAGVSRDRPVVALADPLAGWGEDGRIVWMLRTLGHPAAVLIDGGVAALLADGPPAPAPPVIPGDFTPERTALWEIFRDEVKARLGDGRLSFLDVREPREFAGETPYGERRGGHLPGARHIWYRELLADDGRLKPPAAIAARLAEAGVGRDREVVAYCTGGVRAAWFTAVLVQHGYAARNYAGSMWEWSAEPAQRYPLARPERG